MSFIRQSTEQARDAFTAMPMQSRIISVMLVIAIAIGLAFLVQSTGDPGRENLFGGRTLSEEELAAVELAFSAAGLNEWEREGQRMTIPSEARSAYLAALENTPALPGTLRDRVQDAIDKASAFEPNDLRLAREMHAKERSLADTITQFREVRWATVEYDRGERIGLNRDRPQSASVVVNPIGTDPLTKHRIEQIKAMISSSYAGMSVDDVAVIDTNSTSGFGTDDDDPLLKKQREAEAYVERKVRSLLSGFPVRVAASAEIDPTMDVEKTTLKYDAEPTSLMTRSRKIESETNKPLNGGVPGAVPNGVGSNRPMSLENMEVSKNKEDERESTGVAGQEYENSRVASLQVKRIRVTVGLPVSYYGTIHRQQWLLNNPDQSAADVPKMDDAILEDLRDKTKRTIQSAVTPLLAEVAAGEDRFPLVEVWDYPDLPEPPPMEPQTAQALLTWLADSWQTLLLVLLGTVALLVARSAATGGAADDSPREFREGFGLEIPAPPPEPEEEEGNDQMTITGVSLKEELTSIVEGNPEVAANVIRSWVGDAA